ILLCRLHHRLVHEGGWSLTGDACGQVEFRRPGGRLMQHVPRPAPTEVVERLFGPEGAGAGLVSLH
ncbi:MAG: hypothetical protein ACRD0I_08010, partial [Acidimicrobiales bacterium]